MIFAAAVFAALCLGGIAQAQTPTRDEAALIAAIVAVESGGRADAVGDGGEAVGAMQIHPGLVRDVNRIAGTSYTLSDRLDAGKSAEMFLIYVKHYAADFDAEKWARMWNGGPKGPSKRATLGYWHKVRKQLEAGK